jgi:hypothetical protein
MSGYRLIRLLKQFRLPGDETHLLADSAWSPLPLSTTSVKETKRSASRPMESREAEMLPTISVMVADASAMPAACSCTRASRRPTYSRTREAAVRASAAPPCLVVIS